MPATRTSAPVGRAAAIPPLNVPQQTPKKTRAGASKKWRKDVLKAAYQEKSNPTKTELEVLAEKTQMSLSSVKNWFAKERKKTRLETELALLPGSMSVHSSLESASQASYQQGGHIVSRTASLYGHPLEGPSLTRSPSLGYIPSAFSMSHDASAEETELFHQFETAGNGSVSANLQDSQGSQPESRCFQILSEVTEQLTCEAESQFDAAQNHGYGSFFAGVPTQPHLVPHDFMAYSLSTIPSQSSADVLPSSSLQNLITGRLISHHESIAATQSSRTQPISMTIKLGDLREMSRRVNRKYYAYLATARTEGEENNQSLWELVSANSSHAGFELGGLPTPSSVLDHILEDTDDEAYEAITPSVSTQILPHQILCGSKMNSHATVEGLQEGVVPSFVA